MIIERASYVAEVIPDQQDPLLWHWLVQRRGDAEILALGQEATKEAAIRAAEESISEFIEGERRAA